jgi:acylphosphatase
VEDAGAHPYNRLFMRVARRFGVTGRVQGVGFRYFVQEAADREGVMGYVRNLPDGSVEAYVEGEAEAVTRVERAIRQGPGGAHVKNVNVDDEEPGGYYKGFSIE